MFLFTSNNFQIEKRSIFESYYMLPQAAHSAWEVEAKATDVFEKGYAEQAMGEQL